MSEQKNLKPKYEKLAQNIVCVLAIAVVGLTVLEMTDIWEAAGDAALPLLGCMLLLQAYLHWNQRRKLAVFSACVGAMGLFIALVDLFV